MTKRLPPVPPTVAAPKDQAIRRSRPFRRQEHADRPPENLEEQDRQGNIKQNTTNQVTNRIGDHGEAAWPEPLSRRAREQP